MFESKDPGISADADDYPRWLGDIGGTNARFGWQAEPGAPITHLQVLLCAEHASLADAAQAYLREQQLSGAACAAFGIATPITGEHVRLTNHHWTFSVHALRTTLGLRRLLVLNDFTALALSLRTLPASALRQVGSGAPAPEAPVALIGPGTGLGVSGLLPIGYRDKWMPLAGEGGHVTLAASTDEEYAVLSHLRRRYGHASAERVVSGTGLVDLYHTLCELREGVGRDITTPADVLERALESPQSTAHHAIDLFCGFLGSVAGDLALTLGARGGVYIGGGIVPRLGNSFDASPFRRRFEDKGRFRSYLENVPTWVIESAVSPALAGASTALTLARW